MGLFKSLAGMVEVELTSADVGGALAAVSNGGIRIYQAGIQGDLTARFRIDRKDYRRLLRLTEKRGETLRVIGRKGFYWTARQLLRRPLLLAGVSLLVLMALFLPSRIYFVQVEGNEKIPTRLILETAADSGICFGASRRAVRSEQMKNELLAALPELQWAGVNTYGCVAVITVRERSIPEKTETREEVSSIVAARDGVILSCTATRGNLVCTVGQAVKRGDVLISGYTDCGLTITATRAEGEILAQTRRELTAVSPSECEIRGRELSRTVKYSLLIGKKRINFYKGSGIWDASCGKMYEEYHLTLPGGFQLPVTLVKEMQISYETSEAQLEQSAAETQLTAFAKDYLHQIMVAGSIVNFSCEVVPDGEAYCLTGAFSCTEMIGSVRYEKIGDYNGKTD